MRKIHTWLFSVSTALLIFVACTVEEQGERDLISDPFPEAHAEIRDAILSIRDDIESANIEGLQAIHLESDKFTKFGPRSFERQDVASTNQSEANFFSSISKAKYDVRELKIDVFGDVGVATYYPEVNFVRNGEEVAVSGRQTLVFLKTRGGWKLVHEHGTVRNK